LDINCIRQQFSVFSDINLKNSIFLDGAAGTQMCTRSVDASVKACINHNANLGGLFMTSSRARTEIEEARKASAHFFNAYETEEIIFGQNMTTLTYNISRCLGRSLKPGDEIVLTQSDHESNISPWLELANDSGLIVKWLPFNLCTYGFDASIATSIINDRTKIVALNYANNVTGTINDIAQVSTIAKKFGALVYVDAVHFAPHGILDVQSLGCDFVVCSSHKLYGPHQGILWGRLDLLESLLPYKLRPTINKPPYKFETGTKNREAIAGFFGAIEHLKWIGKEFGGCAKHSGVREQIVAGMTSIIKHETCLLKKTIKGLQAMEFVTIHGYTAPSTLHLRTPTISFTVHSVRSELIALQLAKKGIFLWHGNNFSPETIKQLKLDDQDGVIRVSISQYTSEEDIERFLSAMYTLRPNT
jgi:cysteine desulfurase family protein (TIGR01976 family)